MILVFICQHIKYICYELAEKMVYKKSLSHLHSQRLLASHHFCFIFCLALIE